MDQDISPQNPIEPYQQEANQFMGNIYFII